MANEVKKAINIAAGVLILEMIVNRFRYISAARKEAEAEGKEYSALEDPEIFPYVFWYIIGMIFTLPLFWFVFSSFLTGLLCAVFWPVIILMMMMNAGTEDNKE
jgi:hypothetical protein